MSTKFGCLAALALLTLASLFQPTQAQIPRTLNYQGYLTSPSGSAINSASLAMIFKIYTVQTGGSALHTETQSVTVSNGIFNVLLGTSAALTLPFDIPYFLGVTMGTDPEMTPRQPLAASPYAIRAASAESLAATATVAGSQITGAISTATLPTANLTGTVATAQIADASVTAAKLASNSCSSGQVLQYNGSAWVCASPAGSSGGTVTSITAGTGLTGGTITAAGTLAADTAFLQRRVAATCAVGSSIRAIAADGSVTCQTDTTGGSGTVTSITAGTGLTGGTITTTGTIGLGTVPVANGGTGQTSLTSNGVVLGQGSGAVATTAAGVAGQVLAGTASAPVWTGSPSLSGNLTVSGGVGVGGAVIAGSTLTVAGRIESTSGGVKFPDGSVQTTAASGTGGVFNVAAPKPNTLTAVDTLGDVGLYTSITVAPDGLPVISYWDATNFDLKVVKCGNAACSSGNTITAVDTAGIVGLHTSITIGADGLPVISYSDDTNSVLKVAKCGNAACSSGNTVTVVDNGVAIGGNVGSYTSITLGADGLPVISYLDASSFDLRVAKCGNAACSAGNTLTTVDTDESAGQHTSIIIGADGLPVISYYDGTNGYLKVAKCGNAACSSGNTRTAVDTAGSVGSYSSITIGTDGLPIISYYDTTNGDLKVAKCASTFCTPYFRRR